MKYDLSKLMKKAWSLFNQKGIGSFSDALKRAWAWIKVQDTNRARVEAAALAAGIDQVYRSWAGWKFVGRQVIHGERASFQVTIDTPERGTGKTRLESYFTYDQTQTAPAD